MMKPVCALTGGRGYVGSRIRTALEASGWQVLLLCRNPVVGDENELGWDLGQSGDLQSRLKERNVDALVHAAWDFNVLDPDRYRRINIAGTESLLQSARDAGVRRIVFISTISAFEEAKSLYGRAKLQAEKISSQYGALSMRPGLVYGSRPGGVFGAMRKSVSKGGIVPLIGSGKYLQYLVHEDDLGATIAQAIDGNLPAASGEVITVANPTAWPFRNLLKEIARLEHKEIRLVSIPWKMVYSGLKLAESMKIPLGFRSDSVLSLVNQNPAPDFSPLARLNISVRPFPQGVA